MEMANINLGGILPSATIMVVSVTGSTTNGEPLDEEELALTLEACDELLKLDEAKKTILDFVESRMQNIAPNLSAVVGTATASKLMGAVGGLKNLCKLTANAILGLGSNKKTLTGMSNKNVDACAFLESCELVLSTPPSIRVRVLRLVAGKATLAARVDQQQTDPLGMAGQKFRDLCLATIEKWLEPPPAKTVKSLPAPDPTERKTRGGKRMRKIKERYKATDMMAAANRLSMNGVEEGIYTGNTIAAESLDGEGLGMMGAGGMGNGMGKIKMSESEEKRIKAAGDRALKKQRLHDGGGSQSILGVQSVIGGRSSSVIPGRSSSIIPGRSSSIMGSVIPGRSSAIQGGGRNTAGAGTSGMSSSLAFTPIQGIELHNPNASKESGARTKTDESYFNNGDAFAFTKKA